MRNLPTTNGHPWPCAGRLRLFLAFAFFRFVPESEGDSHWFGLQKIFGPACVGGPADVLSVWLADLIANAYPEHESIIRVEVVCLLCAVEDFSIEYITDFQEPRPSTN